MASVPPTDFTDDVLGPALADESGTNVGAAERGISVTLGAALIAFSAARRRPVSSLVLAAAGAWLAHRGITGRCALYEQLDLGSLDDESDDRLDAGAHDDASAQAAITIGRSPEDVYAFWRRLENAPSFMEAIQSVEQRGGGRSLWVARGPAGDTWRWESEIIEDRPGELIAWRSLPGSDVHHHGAVRFRPAPAGRGTEVRLHVEVLPPGGVIGRALARLGHRFPEHAAAEDLRRLKQILEAGETPVAGFPRGGGDDEARA